MLISTRHRLGEPVVVAYGPSRSEEGLSAGLLFVNAGLRDERITLTDGLARVPVSLPESYLNLAEPQWFAGVTLKERP